MLLNELFEARRADVTYSIKETKGKLEKVTAQLEAAKSGDFTKLAKRYKELKELTEQLKIKQDELNKETKLKVESYFDAEDEILTRVVETASLTATLAKASESKPQVDYEKVVKELEKMMPELKEKLGELIKMATTMSQPKSPALRVTLGEDVASMWNTFVSKAKALLSNIMSWGRSYDAKLAKVKSMMQGA